jgi:hypothetical protein
VDAALAAEQRRDGQQQLQVDERRPDGAVEERLDGDTVDD